VQPLSAEISRQCEGAALQKIHLPVADRHSLLTIRRSLFTTRRCFGSAGTSPSILSRRKAQVLHGLPKLFHMKHSTASSSGFQDLLLGKCFM